MHKVFKIVLATLAWLTINFYSQAQLPFPLPATQAGTNFGKYLQRTMSLLESSTPQKRNTVKIVVYGQSISEQAWSDTVKRMLTTRYPYANIQMVNRSIGAHSSQLLKKPMYFDINTFYPDLVIFHVYGSHYDLDSIMNNIRRNTVAEVLFQNSHVTKNDSASSSWENTYGYTHIPNIAKKYGLEFADIRTPWYQYVRDNNLKANDLTSDGTHLNTRGNFLMARLVERYLVRKPQFVADSLETVKTYYVGTDIDWENGKLTLPFKGNKVDIIADVFTGSGVGTASISIDGISPSMHPGVVMFTRPSVPYDLTWKNGWPWNVGGPIRISNFVPLLDETWTLTITGYTQNGSNRTVNFSVGGSKTGFDGSGTVSYSGNTPSGTKFVSNSKRVVINGDDWFTYLSISNPYNVGHKISWEARKFYTNTFTPPLTVNPAIETQITVAQNLKNIGHKLEIVADNGVSTSIKAIRVYYPPSLRPKTNPQLESSINNTTTVCKEIGVDLTKTFTDKNDVSGEVLYFPAGIEQIAIGNPKKITQSGVYRIRKSAYATTTTSDLLVTVTAIRCFPGTKIAKPDTACAGAAFDLYTIITDTADVAVEYMAYTTTLPGSAIEDMTAVPVPGKYYIKATSEHGYSTTDSVSILAKECVVSIPSSVNTQHIDNNLVKIYPNPATTEVYFQTDSPLEVVVKDALGVVQISKSIYHSQYIQLQNLSKGIYIVEIYQGKTKSIQKLVVE